MGTTALVTGVIDVAGVTASVEKHQHGATVVFLGTVRDTFRGRRVEAITYHAYEPMAASELARLVAEESAALGVEAAVIHRLGRLAPGEASVVIAVSSPHRDLGYEVSRRLLERLKREVPIWKHEHYADGESTWREEEALGC